MKLEPGMAVTVKLDNEELQFLIVRTGGDGKERLSLEAPLAQQLSRMAVGEACKWQASVPGSDGYECWLMRVELVAVEG